MGRRGVKETCELIYSVLALWWNYLVVTMDMGMAVMRRTVHSAINAVLRIRSPAEVVAPGWGRRQVPVWMRLLRWYSLHVPRPRGAYRVAAWMYTRARIPEVEVTARLGRHTVMTLQLNEWVDYNIYTQGAYERPVADWWVEQVREDSVVLDVGAHVGQYTLLAAERARQGRVIAVEPNPLTVQRLEENVRWNQVENVTVVPCALADRPRVLPFEMSLAEPHCGRLVREGEDGIEVRITTVDHLVDALGLQRVDLVKIDVEGVEELVLWGALDTLRRWHPTILVEMERTGESRWGGCCPECIVAELMAVGYRRFELFDGWRLRKAGWRLPDYANVVATYGI